MTTQTSQPAISELLEVNVRDAWAHEAHNFTPWLAENISGLEKAVGIPLEIEGSEVSVESFSADILARNPMDDTRVLIENQLEGSDHTHLGQILTYLAGLEARTVIWIATSFREPHLSALNWLNEHTDESMAFFAIVLKVVRIGDSPYAPIFEVVARPNAWERRLHAATTGSGEVSKHTVRREAFWKEYVERIPGELENHGPPGRSSNRWHVLEDLDLVISIYLSVNGVGIFIRGVRGCDSEELHARFTGHESELVSRLGVERFSASPDSDHILYQWIPGDSDDPADRKKMIDWLAQKSELYESTLRDMLS